MESLYHKVDDYVSWRCDITVKKTDTKRDPLFIAVGILKNILPLPTIPIDLPSSVHESYRYAGSGFYGTVFT